MFLPPPRLSSLHPRPFLRSYSTSPSDMLHLMQWLINPKEEVHGLSCTFGNTLFFCRTSFQIIMNRHDAQITPPPTPCLHVLDLSAHHHSSCLHTLGESFNTHTWGGLRFQVLTNLFASLDLYIGPVSVFIIHMGIPDRDGAFSPRTFMLVRDGC